MSDSPFYYVVATQECEKIIRDNGNGRKCGGVWKCTKPGRVKDVTNNRILCIRHFDKWQNKINKSNSEQVRP